MIAACDIRVDLSEDTIGFRLGPVNGSLEIFFITRELFTDFFRNLSFDV